MKKLSPMVKALMVTLVGCAVIIIAAIAGHVRNDDYRSNDYKNGNNVNIIDTNMGSNTSISTNIYDNSSNDGDNDNGNDDNKNNREGTLLDENLPEEGKEKTGAELIELLIKKMTLEEKIGQLLMVGIEEKEVDEATAGFLRSHKVGGVILFERNIENPEQVKSLTRQLQELGSGPPGVGMLIGIDQEGGKVNRLPWEKGRFPSASNLASSGQPEIVRDAASRMAAQLKELGINMNFAPVLDINSNPDNPVIGDRAFGNNPEIVSQMGPAFMEGTLDEGIIPVAKHFPGHGDTSLDSHTDLPVVAHSMDRLRNFELVPFEEAIKNGVPAIMTAHILLPLLDEDAPATLSPAIIKGLLREQLQFEGVVITDDLGMAAIAGLYTTGQAAVKAVKAGVDTLLICHGKEGVSQAFEALLAAVGNEDAFSGSKNVLGSNNTPMEKIVVEEIDNAVFRVLTLKKRFGLVRLDEN